MAREIKMKDKKIKEMEKEHLVEIERIKWHQQLKDIGKASQSNDKTTELIKAHKAEVDQLKGLLRAAEA